MQPYGYIGMFYNVIVCSNFQAFHSINEKRIPELNCSQNTCHDKMVVGIGLSNITETYKLTICPPCLFNRGLKENSKSKVTN